MQVTMADGLQKLLSEVKAGDRVVTVDPVTQLSTTVTVKELTVHAAKNYAVTRVMLLSATENSDRVVTLVSKVLQATPNHPMVTAEGDKKMGELKEGDKVLCLDEKTGRYQEFTVWDKTEAAGGGEPVFNIGVGGGRTVFFDGGGGVEETTKD